jgi:cytochrome P450
LILPIGPVVRITPDEIHLSDPENYDKIYYVGSKYAKSPNFYNAMCVPTSTFGTTSIEVHRIRRGAMNPMFSRKMVLELESVVQDKARKVCNRMQAGIEKGVPVDLHHAFRSVSIDVISDFAFNKSYEFLNKDDLGSYFFRTIHGAGPALWVFQQFPSLQAAALMMPPWLAPYLSEALGMVMSMQQECVKQVEDVKKRMKTEKFAEERPTIFSTLLSEKDKPDGYRIPSTMDLKDEAYSVLAAAADTTGNAMTVAAFNVMRTPQIYQKLVQELEKAFPDSNAELSFTELERLPYLVSLPALLYHSLTHSLSLSLSLSPLTTSLTSFTLL